MDENKCCVDELQMNGMRDPYGSLAPVSDIYRWYVTYAERLVCDVGHGADVIVRILELLHVDKRAALVGRGGQRISLYPLRCEFWISAKPG